MTFKLGFCLVTLVLLMSSLSYADSVAESVNTSSVIPLGVYFGQQDIGWNYTPGSTYQLSGILTEFGNTGEGCMTTCPSSVTVVVENSPGGAILASGSFAPAIGALSGVEFASPISFLAGTQYFIALENVTGLPVNYTSTGSNSLQQYSDFLGGGTFNSGPFNTSPILEFLTPSTTSVPEPSSMMLLGSGVLGLLGPIRRRLLG